MTISKVNMSIILFLVSTSFATTEAQVSASVFKADTIRKLGVLANDSPHPSPDGKDIVYTANFSGNWQVYKKNLLTNNVTRLTYHFGDDETPVWSPDGKKILYESSVAGNREIFVMNADGTGQNNISNNKDVDMHPTWHPDGKSILFNSNRDDTTGMAIYSMSPFGSFVNRLSDPKDFRTYASWSPDGKNILYVKWVKIEGRESMEREIYIMNASGTKEINISKSPSSTEGWPTWSPDGKTVVFASDRTGKYQLYLVNTDGSNCRQIIQSDFEDKRPYFSTDGSKLYFDRRIPGVVVDIFVAEIKSK